MNLMATVIFENSFCEMYLPNVNNRVVPMDIRPDVSGLDRTVTLGFEVWNGEWLISENEFLQIADKNGRVKSIVLASGLALNCTISDKKTVFSLTLNEVSEGNTRFDKFFLDRQGATIGNDKKNSICFSDRFISPQHAKITAGANDVYSITDLDSINGTFVNGRMLNGTQRLYYGDIIYIIGLKLIYLGNIIAVNNPRNAVQIKDLVPVQLSDKSGDQDAPVKISDDFYLRTPRQLERLDTEPVSIEPCPAPNKQQQQPLLFTIGPAFTMVIPMAAGAMMTGGSGMGMSGLVMSLGAALIGGVWALVNVNYQKKETTRQESARVNGYKQYISKMVETIKTKADSNRRVLNNRYPAPQDYAEWVEKGSRRLWEKSSSHDDFLSVRVGLGTMPSPNPINIPQDKPMMATETDALSREPQRILSEMSVLRDVPVAISFYQNRMIGVVAKNPEHSMELAKTISAQIAGLHPYTDVRMAYIYDEKQSDRWSFARWLPHTWMPDGKLRLCACDKLTTGDMLYGLSDMLRIRMDKQKEKKDEEAKVLPHYCVFVADMSLLDNEPAAKYLLDPTPEMGLTTIFLVNSIDKLPGNCTAIIQHDSDIKALFSITNSFERREEIKFDTLPDDDLDYVARQLSGIRVREINTSTAIPDVLTFLDMYHTSKVEDIDMMRKWLENRTYESMKSLVGYKGGGLPLYLDIHEKYHGPHGLVAGTTGSGKSETLQSYILSLAINYHPHEVSFILIDYKGGGMAQSFEGLPHIAGIITNLGGNQTNRALASINSEIKRRQSVFSEYKVKHIDTYIELYRNEQASEPIPHLLIIADEFAELKKEQPDFVRALVSAARVGRSLGVHLILATQKPSGVVDEEIWGNTRFRLCLRVADRMDSNEMIKRPDAAYITAAGRAFFQVGADEIFEEFQSGWSGAEYEPDVPFADDKNSKAEVIGLLGRPSVIKAKKKKAPLLPGQEAVKKVTQLDAIVQYAAHIAQANAIPPIRQIWLAPLPSQLYLSDMEDFTQRKWNGQNWQQGEWELRPVIGLADDPMHQRQYPVTLDFLNDGHLIISGSAGGGKTTLLQTILYSTAMTYSPKRVSMYVIDFNSRTMGTFGLLPHVGAVAFEGDDDKVERMIAMMQKEVANRKMQFSQKSIGSFKEYVRLYDDVPAILFAIDNFIAFNETYPEYEDVFVQLTREAASYGVYIILTCNNSGDIRSRIRQNLPYGIGLQMSDRFEYETAIGERTETIAESKTPGRGLVRAPEPVEFQTAIAVQASDAVAMNLELHRQFEAVAESTDEGAAAIQSEVEQIRYDVFAARQDVSALPPYMMPLAISAENGRLLTLDLRETFCYTVGGAGRTGKTNLLRVIARQAQAAGGEVYIFDDTDMEMRQFAEQLPAQRYMTDVDSLFAFMSETLVPAFSERNGLVASARETGADVEEALNAIPRIFVLINSMSAFCEAAYNEEKSMNDFLELALVKGKQHRIYFFAAITPNDYEEYITQPVMRNYIAWHEGLHLGGLFDQQIILDWEMSPSDRVRKLSPGVAYMVENDAAVKVITPLEASTSEEDA